LALAISQLKGNTKYSVPLVVFGHMHKRLAFGDDSRNMIVVGDDNTIFLNGAVVPRVKRFGDNPLTGEPKHTLRAFTLIDSKEGKVDKIAEAWVSVIGDNTSVKEEHILFSGNMLNTSHIFGGGGDGGGDREGGMDGRQWCWVVDGGGRRMGIRWLEVVVGAVVVGERASGGSKWRRWQDVAVADDAVAGDGGVWVGGGCGWRVVKVM
ncbi:hypothetical protein R6Q59_021099, partial [Mikania micrantha]